MIANTIPTQVSEEESRTTHTLNYLGVRFIPFTRYIFNVKGECKMKKMTKQEMRELLLGTMHEYLRLHVSDEEAYMSWILVVPDEPRKEDIEYIAEDNDEWKHCVELFHKILEEYEDEEI